MNNQEYQQLKEKALKQFKSGQALFEKNGAFAPILKSLLEEALKTEMDAYLNQEARSGGINETVKKPSVSKAQMVLL